MFQYLTLVSMLLLSMDIMAADITTTVDRGSVAFGESFRITFESDGAVDDDPDFSPLNRDFQIISNNVSSNMSIINGDVSRTKQWQLNVLPRRTGNLVIPAVRFGRDISNPVTITVTERATGQSGQRDQDIFLEVEAKPERPYVQSQIIFTARLYRAIATANASLTEPQVTGANAVIERIGEDRSYETRRGGRRYAVVERSYAIYPQASGSMTIGALMFRGQPSRGSFFSFDPFGPQPDMIVRQSRPITLNVLPIPDSYTAAHWLPARKLSLTEQWSQDPPRFKVGEPITRTLTLSATGVTASQLPELPQWSLPDFKQYPDQPSLEQTLSGGDMIGTRVEKTAIIPNRAGDYLLPEIRVPWWNTATNTIETAVIPERRITVLAGQPAASPEAVSPAPVTDLDSRVTTVTADAGGETKPAQTETPAAPQPQPSSLWQWLTLVLATGWAITLFILWRTRPRHGREVIDNNRTEKLRRVVRELQKACVQNDISSAKDILLKWGRVIWPESPPTNIGEIGRRSTADMSRQIRLMNDALYSREQGGWDGRAFWLAFKREMNGMENGRQQSSGNLEPLYRL